MPAPLLLDADAMTRLDARGDASAWDVRSGDRRALIAVRGGVARALPLGEHPGLPCATRLPALDALVDGLDVRFGPDCLPVDAGRPARRVRARSWTVFGPAPLRAIDAGEPIDALPGWAWTPALDPWAPIPAVPPPWLVGHRGAPAHLPDHTLEGYALAALDGADAIEPDLVSTRDGHLIARHENELSRTTDVADRFPERRTVREVDGEAVDGWFAEDLDLSEVRALRARQPWPERPAHHDGLYAVPTFDEVLDAHAALEREVGRPLGLAPELKHVAHLDARGHDPVGALCRSLTARGLVGDPRVIVQSFEPDALDRVRRTCGASVLWLFSDRSDALADLAAVRRRVHAIGVPREAVWAADGPTGLVERAHAAGLRVFVYTFRTERPGFASDDPAEELRRFLALGVDGLFVDDPAHAVRARAD